MSLLYNIKRYIANGAARAIHPRLESPDSSPHRTLGGEQQSDRPEATGCKASQPAPAGPPPGRPLLGACQGPTPACHVLPALAQRPRGRRVTRALGHHGKPQRLPPLPPPAALVRHAPRLVSAPRARQAGTPGNASASGRLPAARAAPGGDRHVSGREARPRPASAVEPSPLAPLPARAGWAPQSPAPLQGRCSCWGWRFPDPDAPPLPGRLARS